MKIFLRLLLMAGVTLGLARTSFADGTVMTWPVDGVARQALVYAPTAASTSGKIPVVFAFHGHGGNMNNASHSNFQGLWPEALVVYAQGLPTPMPADPQG